MNDLLRYIIWQSAMGGGGAGIEKTVGPAPVLSVSDALAKPVKALSVDIAPVQDTHGFDPFPAGTTKNLLDETAFTDGYYIAADGTITSSNDSMYSALIPVTAGESYTWSGKTVGASNNKRLHGYLDGVWVEQIFYESISSESFSRTVTIPSGVNGIRVSEHKTDYDIMIELGSTATSYIPYSNICPISGWTGCTIYDDPAYGRSIDWNQIAKHDSSAWTLARVSLSFTDTDTIFTTTSSSSIKIARLPVPIGHKILVKGVCKTTSTYAASIGMYDPTKNNDYSERYTLSVPSTDTPFAYIMESDYDHYTVGIAFSTVPGSGVHIDLGNFQIFDLTQMFGAGNEPTTVAEFDALFYKDYYAYDSGSATCVSAVNGDPYRLYEIDWTDEAGTVYGGTLDVPNGVLSPGKDYFKGIGSDIRTVTGFKVLRTTFSTTNYSMYEPVISNMFTYLSSGDFSKRWQVRQASPGVLYWSFPADYTDEQILAISPNVEYLLYRKNAARSPVQLSPQKVTTLPGDNSVFADCGDSTMTYVAKKA